MAQEQQAGSRRRRVDAARNREAILSTAQQVFVQRPDAGLAEVARASGLTRTTVYAHFTSREQLLDELQARAVERTVALIDASDQAGLPASEALVRVLAASWQQVGQHARLLAAAGRLDERPGGRHAPIAERLLALIRRGRNEGAFRADVPEEWLLITYFALVHAAGREVAEGSVRPADAELWLGCTLLGAWAPQPG